MLERHAASGMLLHAPCDGGGYLAGYKRVLGIVFEIPSAAYIPVDIERRRKPQMHAEAFHLVAHDIAAAFGKAHVPATLFGNVGNPVPIES